MNPDTANQYIDAGMALGTYIMGALAEQGYPMTTKMGRTLKEKSEIDLQRLLGGPTKELIKQVEPTIKELADFIRQQDEL